MSAAFAESVVVVTKAVNVLSFSATAKVQWKCSRR